ncbi:unnamed protein product [Ixodes hexagonus]
MDLVRGVLPPQPFYTTAFANIRCWRTDRGGRYYSCLLLPQHLRGDLEKRRVLLFFHNFREPLCKHDEVRVTLKINDASFYGVPLKTLNVTRFVAVAVNSICIEGISITDGLYISVHVVDKTPEHDLLQWALGCGMNQVYDIADTQRLARMRVPCRGARCEHVQTFDAMAYLELNEGTLRPTWRCPVCDRSVKVEELKIDLFILELLHRLLPSCGAIELLADGRYEPVMNHHEVVLIEESPTKPPIVGQSHDVSVIDLTGDTSSDDDA